MAKDPSLQQSTEPNGAAVAELAAHDDAVCAAYTEAMAHLRELSWIERAEGWLRFWALQARQVEGWGHQEAIIYLASRRHDYSSYARGILEWWRAAEGKSIERHKDALKSPGVLTITQEPVFWRSSEEQEISILATMLRTAEWCRIPGFDIWWQWHEAWLSKHGAHGRLEPTRLFNFCRTDYLLLRMDAVLRRALDLVEIRLIDEHGLAYREDPPWFEPPRNWRGRTKGGKPVRAELNLAKAAKLVFCHTRLDNGRAVPLVTHALDDLMRCFDHRRGAWHYFSGLPDECSVQATAVAAHALACATPDVWEQHYAVPAREWLLSQQQADGYWLEGKGAVTPWYPDPVYLTVLVLDALELASGGTMLTFRQTHAPTVFIAYQHEDSRWLGELKKHLGHLLHSRKIECFDDREIKSGSDWDPLIKSKLMGAKIIVPLISHNFIGSSYVQTVEFPTAMQRHRNRTVTVLPFLLDECDWQGLQAHGVHLAGIAMLPKDEKNNLRPLVEWRNKNRAFVQVARRIRELVEAS